MLAPPANSVVVVVSMVLNPAQPFSHLLLLLFPLSPSSISPLLLHAGLTTENVNTTSA